MKTAIKNIKYIIIVILFTTSCQLSEDLMDAMNEYNTDAMLTVTVSPGAAAVYNNDAMVVTLTPSEPEFTIKYTTDGSDPSRTAGTEYTAPFPIDTASGFTAGSTIEIRVVAYDENKISNVVSRTVVLGDGLTAATSYEIATALQLATAATRVNSGVDAAASFRQVADISLSGYSSGAGWTPIGVSPANFTGTYNGGNFYITDLTINDSTNNKGLFGYTDTGATLQNIRLSNVNITGNDYTGSLAGRTNGTVITNCTVTGTASVSGVNYVGGLTGNLQDSDVANCYANAIVSGTDYIGGLTGDAYGAAAGNTTLISCSSSGTVTGITFVGGLAGNSGGPGGGQWGALFNSSSSSSDVTGYESTGGFVGSIVYGGNVTNCSAAGDVTGTALASYIGGFAGNIGYSPTTISSSHATGNVNASTAVRVGGFIGQNTSSSTVGINNYATGDVTGGNHTGGFIGYNASTINSGNYATGDVNGTNNVGGFAGYNNAAITSCWYTSGTVTGTGSYTGGFVGVNTSVAGIISKCYSTGTVNGTSTVGGLVGNNSTSARIDLSSSRCTVSGTANVGGLVGQNGPGAAQIYNSYARGTVNCSGVGAYSGGLVGSLINNPVIIYCFSTGLVTSASGEGLFGYYDGLGATWGTALLWDIDTSGKTTYTGGATATGQNTVNMLLQATYSNYNFTAVTGDWSINPALNDGYPYLQWESL